MRELLFLIFCSLSIHLIPAKTVSEEPFKCNEAGVFVDPKDCLKFYICDGNLTAIHGECLQGSFDPKTKVCISSTCTQTKPTTFVCEKQGTFADSRDCHKFFYCNRDLTRFEQTCTEFGHFDPDQVCKKGPCPNERSMRKLVIEHSEFDCKEAGDFADPKNCHNFYTCDSTLFAIKKSCMDGKGSFDSVTKTCTETGCTDPIPAPETKKTFRCPSIGLFEDPDDCQNFYSCFENLTPILARCLDGSFSLEKRSCVAEPCSSTLNVDFKCYKSGYFPDPSNCHKFFSCDNDLKLHHKTCTEHGHFDPVDICVAGPCPSEPTTTHKPTLGDKILQFFSSGQSTLSPSSVIIQIALAILVNVVCL